MNHEYHEHGTRNMEVRAKGPGSTLWQKFAVYGAVAVVLFYLLTEHRAHFFGALPYLLLLACPLMHFFMHGNHRAHTHENREDKK